MTARIKSEAELIETYLAPLAAAMPGALSLKDDCAVFQPPPGREIVVTTDAVAAGIHFFPSDAARDIAWKALAVNVSDLAAKGAEPLAYQMALSFPEAPEHTWLAEFAAGLAEAQAAFGLVLSGGDTDRRPGPLTITITAMGTVPQGAAVRRTGGHPGDDLYVTGTLGDATLGLALRHDPSLAERWGLAEADERWLLQRYRRPEPRIALAAPLRQHASAAIDISDGLLKDLGHLCAASGVLGTVAAAALPLSRAASRALARDPHLMARVCTGGDDYELLVAVAVDRSAAFAGAARDLGLQVTQIGALAAGQGVAVQMPDGTPLTVERAGWDHF